MGRQREKTEQATSIKLATTAGHVYATLTLQTSIPLDQLVFLSIYVSGRLLLFRRTFDYLRSCQFLGVVLTEQSVSCHSLLAVTTRNLICPYQCNNLKQNEAQSASLQSQTKGGNNAHTIDVTRVTGTQQQIPESPAF